MVSEMYETPYLTSWSVVQFCFKICLLNLFNTTRPGDAYMCRRSVSQLIQVMAFGQLDPDPLIPDPILTYYHLHP